MRNFTGSEIRAEVCHTKAKEPILYYYFIHNWREYSWIHTFSPSINAIWDAINLVQDLNSVSQIHFL